MNLITNLKKYFFAQGIKVDAYMASILVGLTRLVCSMANTVLLRRYKRRVLCIISSLGMAICMTVSGYYKMKIEEGSTEGNWVRFLLKSFGAVTHPTVDRDQSCLTCVITEVAY